MIEKRCIIACKVLWREINFLTAKSPFCYDVYYLEQGLHNIPADLNRELQEKIYEIENDYTHVLIGYGLCSNGISGIKSDKSTLVFIRAHDCITFFLGSKHLYRELFDNHPGTYWYNTGWIETSGIPNEKYYLEKKAEYTEKYDEEAAQFLIDSEMEWLSKYNTLSYINQGIINEDSYIDFSKNSAKYLNWQYKEFDGDLELMRDWLDGNWDNERFLVLFPGEEVEPSFDDGTIIKSTIPTKST